MTGPGAEHLARLEGALASHEHLVLAVSGGVDSMTLAHLGVGVLGPGRVEVCHAVSPAVPGAATERVRAHADRHGWRLRLLDAGEFADPDYLRNPVNRCYFCKSNLYARIREYSSGTIASGANLDDLNDFRPGLEAARELGVTHPFIDAAWTKADVRATARKLGLDDISELPAQPCLASRIETGLRVTPEDLHFVETAERLLEPFAPGKALRCRVVAEGVRVEIGDWNRMDATARHRIAEAADRHCEKSGRRLVAVTDYRRGSAFRHAV